MTSTSKVAVLGAGAWGTALARVLADNGMFVEMWSRRAELAEQINEARENVRYLPGAMLPATLIATHDMAATLDGASMVLFVAPSHSTREVARAAAPHIKGGIPIISATKGIENDSLMFMDEVLHAELPTHARSHLTFLSGPSFAKELAAHLPTAVVIASRSPDDRDAVMHAMDERHPGYGFAAHKGYHAPLHVEALVRLGPCPIHRMSWAPVKLALAGELRVGDLRVDGS